MRSKNQKVFMHQRTKSTKVVCKMVWNYNGRYSKPVQFNQKLALLLATLTLLSLTLIVLPAPVLAHQPSQMALEYDADTQMLAISITHSVPDSTSHYVKKVEITKNGEPLLTKDYTSQPSASTFSYTYAIAADNEDVLDVTAYCSIYGSIREQITVSTFPPSATPTAAETPTATAQPSPTPGTSPTPTPETPGFEVLFALLIGVCAALYLSKR
jgi:desulfoferrodoxin (superoxide reductase-like protein)